MLRFASISKITVAIFIMFFALVIFEAKSSFASVYVYEVTTQTARFHTASKLPPDAFLYYNGGFDIIYDLQVVGVYPDKDMDKALKDYNLEKNNSNMLPFKPLPKRIPRKPFYWWR